MGKTKDYILVPLLDSTFISEELMEEIEIMDNYKVEGGDYELDNNY